MEHFNPRSPCGERPVEGWEARETTLFQSTLPVRGATPTLTMVGCGDNISIHAPRAGSDRDVTVGLVKPSKISIHAPRAGSDGDTEL